MAELAILSRPGADRVLAELVDAIGAELAAQGMVTSVGATWDAPGFDRVWCVVVPTAGEVQLPDPSRLRHTIALVSDVPEDETELQLLRGAGVVFVLEPAAAAALGRLGIVARLLRPGWSPGLDRYVADAERLTDVVVLGAERPRAAAWLADVRERFPAHRWAAADGGSGIAAGATARVVVALHAGAEPVLGWRAPLQASLGGAVLVAEHASDLAPLQPGEHLLVASADALPWVVDAVLRDRARLAQIREAAHERVRTWLPLALPVSRLRAAVVELLAEPGGDVTPG